MFFTEIDEIYFSKTKDYMNEVIESYSIGNYRAATVLLYSVVICDIMLKLQELIDMYNDTVASEILSDIERIRKDPASSKSKWESELLDRVSKKTELLNDISVTNIKHLYDHRNFCAHPALNEDFELFSPNQEVVAAHIRNALTDIFVKPPIFIKNIVEHLSDDLEDKYELFKNDKDNLKVYLHNRYYSKMSLSMVFKVFRAFWKFCFFLDDEHCKKNRLINRHALSILFEYKKIDLIDFVRKENDKLPLSNDELCLAGFVIFIAENQELYKVLSDDKKIQMDMIIEKKDYLKWISWFKYTDLEAHIAYLSTLDLKVCESCFEFVFKHYRNCGYKQLILNFFICYFGKSSSYDDANEKFDKVIAPYLSDFTKEQFILLIQTIDSNDQIYNRWASRECNNLIIRHAKYLLHDVDLKKYQNFVFNYDILEKSNINESTDREMPFP